MVRCRNCRPLQITKYKEICKDVPNESLSVGPGQGVRYAVVTLEGITKGKAVEKETVHELDNIKCRFAPHVQAASIGQFVLLKNSDPILHTAHALFTNDQPQFNIGLYPGRTSRKPLIAAGARQDSLRSASMDDRLHHGYRASLSRSIGYLWRVRAQ